MIISLPCIRLGHRGRLTPCHDAQDKDMIGFLDVIVMVSPLSKYLQWMMRFGVLRPFQYYLNYIETMEE